MLNLTWAQLKSLIVLNNLTFSWVADDNSYTITAALGTIPLVTLILFGTVDQTDFETNYKSLATTRPFAAQTNGQQLYPYNVGMQFSVSNGANTLTYTATKAHVRVRGIEVVNGESLEYCDVLVKDNAIGTFSGVPNATLAQIAFTINVGKDFYAAISRFSNDLYQTMVVQFNYTSNTILPKTIGINLLMDEVR